MLELYFIITSFQYQEFWFFRRLGSRILKIDSMTLAVKGRRL